MTIKINYESIKEIVSDLRDDGIKVTAKDLIVLAPQNDPFYSGAPAQIRDAEWFAELYNKVAGTGQVHLRRIHYRILEELTPDQKMLPTPLTTKDKKTGKTITFDYYQNHERCWNYLTGAAKSARYLDLVPIDTFVDNRAKEASFSFYARWQNENDFDYHDPTPRYAPEGEWSDLDTPEMPEMPSLYSWFGDAPDFEIAGYTMQQPYHIEIWIEKSEGEDVFLPLCQRYGANFVPGVGDMSITTTYRFCERVRQASRPAKLLYVSDFDPSGFNMPVAVARKLEHFVRNYDFDDLDITLEPIMLTAQQVEDYQLPPAPVKESDGRKADWESEHGGAVELNAMFSNERRIAEARRIVEDKILQYYDADLNHRARVAKSELSEALDEQRDMILDSELGDKWEALETQYQAIRDDWQNLDSELRSLLEPLIPQVEDFQQQIEQLNSQARAVHSELMAKISDVDIDAAGEFPLPDTLSADTDDALYYSKCDYFEQLGRYSEYRGNHRGNGFYEAIERLA